MWYVPCQGVGDLASGIARCHLSVRRREHWEVGVPVLREVARERSAQLLSLVGIRDAVLIETAPPSGLSFRASLQRSSELEEGHIRNIERAILWPSQGPLRQPHFFDTEWFPVRLPGILLVRAAVPDMRTRDDQRGPIVGSACRGE